MKKLLVLGIILAGISFGQTRGSITAPQPARTQPPIVRVQPTPQPIHVQQTRIEVVPYGGWNYPSYYGYYPYYTNFPFLTPQPIELCKKETLKDSNNKKHQILVCRQADGKFVVVADADKLNK